MLRELTHTHVHRHTHTQSNVKMEQEELKMLPLKLGVTHQNLVEARERPPSPRASGGESPHRCPGFGLMKLIWGLWPIYLCRFKLPSL